MSENTELLAQIHERDQQIAALTAELTELRKRNCLQSGSCAIVQSVADSIMRSLAEHIERERTPTFDPVLDRHITTLGLHAAITNPLLIYGVITVRDLVTRYSEITLGKIPMLGRKRLGEIEEKLIELGVLK